MRYAERRAAAATWTRIGASGLCTFVGVARYAEAGALTSADEPSARGARSMHSERAQIVLKVSPLTGADTFYVKEALEQLEGVRSAYVDISQGLVKVDGAVTDTELLQTLSALGKSGIVVTHTRGVPGPPPSRPQSTGVLKVTAAPFLLCPPRASRHPPASISGAALLQAPQTTSRLLHVSHCVAPSCPVELRLVPPVGAALPWTYLQHCHEEFVIQPCVCDAVWGLL